MKNRNFIHWMWLGSVICLLEAATAHAFYNPQQGRWLSRDPTGESGGDNLYGFVENAPPELNDFLGLTKVTAHRWSITQQQVELGRFGWTDLESQGETPAELIKKKDACCCAVKRKPEMLFTISVQTAHSGKQSWKVAVEFDGVVYPDSNVYIDSDIAKLSQKHEERRFQGWKEVLTSYWEGHYENPAAKLTAPTCQELQKTIDDLKKKATDDWIQSEDGFVLLVKKQYAIGISDVLHVKTEDHKSIWGVSKHYEYDN